MLALYLALILLGLAQQVFSLRKLKSFKPTLSVELSVLKRFVWVVLSDLHFVRQFNFKV